MRKRKITKKRGFILIFTVILVISFTGCTANDGGNSSKPEIHSIKITDPVDGVIGSAAAADNENPSEKETYNSPLNYYQGDYNETVLLIKNFKTYQQTSEYSCGPACMVMLLNYYGITEVGENALSKEMNACYYDNPREDGSYGTATKDMVKALSSRGFTVQTSKETQDENGYSFPDISEFTSFVKTQLKNGDPILTENVEWGGHWMILIGYDDMGTDTFIDDTLIFADPYDVSDQYQDGYIEKNCYRFYAEWFDNNILPADEKVQQYVTVIHAE